MQENLPPFIENPEEHLLKSLPNCDVVLAIRMRPDLLLTIPTIVKRTNVKGVIVPIENRNWCPPGFKGQLEDKLKRLEWSTPFRIPSAPLKKLESRLLMVSWGDTR